jgi:hypothetical protein
VSRNIGLWIDHKKAVVVSVKTGGEEIKLVQSNVEKRVRLRGGARAKTAYAAQYFPAEDHKDRQFLEKLKKFYGAVITPLRDGDALLVFGPGEAKSELVKRIRREKAGVKIVGVESADKMTQRQIIAKTRGYFKKKEV